MKTGILAISFFCALLFVTTVRAQFTGSGTIDSCFNLQNSVFTTQQILVDHNISYAGGNAIFDFYSIDDGTNCNTSTGCDNSGAALIYDVYYPSPSAYTQYGNAPLPALFLFHSGGFSDCSNKDNDNIGSYCQGFAERGFITFNVEYRRGTVNQPGFVSAEQVLAVYRCFQDARGAIRSAIKRQLNNETNFKIDTSKLFIGGSSAGAIIALGTAFYNQQEMDIVSPGVSDPSILGPLDIDNYYGSVNTAFSLKGVLSMWGGIVDKNSADPSAVALIKPTDNIAVIAFHGEADSTVPFRTQLFNVSTGPKAKATQCGFTYKIPRDITSVMQYGSEAIYNTLRSYNTPTELYADSDAGHGLGATANYGLSTSNTDSVVNYITRRAAIFFQAVNNKIAANLERTKFRDCQNLRTGCLVKDTSCSSLVLNPIVTQVTCNGSSDGEVSLSVSGGSTNVYFSWSGQGGFASTSQNISNLSGGEYHVAATDTLSGAVGFYTAVIINPNVLNMSAQAGDVSCFGASNGAITVTATGGTSPYKYSLNNGSYSNNNSFKNLPAGSYKVDVKDDHSCKKTLDSISIKQPSALDLVLVKKKNVSCINGSDGLIKVNATGGTPLYTYSLNGAAYVSNATFKQLTVGSYTIIVKDKKKCTDTLISVVANGTVACFAANETGVNSSVAGTTSFTNNTLKIQLSPNPAVKTFTLVTESSNAETVTITVSDIFGRKVFQSRGNANSRYIFGHQFLPGIYMLQIVQGKNIRTLKLIKSGL